MNKLRLRFTYILFSFIFAFYGLAQAQDIEIITHEMTLTDTVGAEMVFDFEVVNISNMVQTVFEVRTINDLPSDWTSSLCFGELCFSPFFDSVATTPDFQTPALNPGDTLITSLHVTAFNNEGTANVQIQVGTFRDPAVRTSLDFVANAYPVSVGNISSQPDKFYLDQNYPNPFNPSTIINYGLKEPGNVSLKVYDVLGNEITQLVNGYKPAGNYEINFNGDEFTSGIYIYRLVTGKYTETRKMILEK